VNIVLLEANHDSITASVHKARRLALNAIRPTQGKAVVELFGPNATARALEHAYNILIGYLSLVSGLGHGNSNEFTGHLDETVYQAPLFPTNRTATQAIVHLFSCNCANNLGPTLVQGGAKAFVGYTDFVYVPQDDNVMPFFVSEAAAFDLHIYNGGTISGAKSAADSAHVVARAQLEANAATTPGDLAAFDLNHTARVGPWSNPRYGST
jgi:hypothetical protein